MVFSPVISHLKGKEWGLFGPVSFRGYLDEHGIHTKAKTADKISVDSFERLDIELRKSQAMVLRLGTATDKPGSTQFAVIKTPGKLEDFFLHDEHCFTNQNPETFIPDVPLTNLLPYYVFPKLTEKTMVNLAFASGLIGNALYLDEPFPTSAPATGNGTYTFRFQAHTDFPVILDHRSGQVEIDAVFLGRRNDQEILFVLEAKSGDDKTLAKHKLVYPILAIAQNVPKEIPIVPVYLKVRDTGQAIQYHIVECEFPDPRENIRALNELRVVRHRYFSINHTEIK